MYLIDTVLNYRGGRYGFFSGHACNTSCVAMFLALLFREKRLTLILFLWSITTTYTRLYLGVHYLGDVLVGWSVGLTLGSIFYYLYSRHRRRTRTSQHISGQFTSSGYPLCDIHLFITAIAFNYIIITIFATARGII